MIEEQLSFLSEGLRLEARLSYADDAAAPDAKVLLCPPHPFLGGDMDNNVLTALAETLTEHELVVMRFNYRGIGRSETDRDLHQDQKAFWEHSSCPEYEARIFRDAATAMQTLIDMLATDKPVFVVGYSFGCLPAIRLAAEHGVSRLALISPPLTKWQFDPKQLQFGAHKKLFYSTDDFACPAPALHRLHEDMAPPKAVQAFHAADHFFIGQERLLAAAVVDFLGLKDRVQA